MSGIRARIFCNADLNTFDYIFAMDKKNLADLSNSTSGRSDGKVKLLLGFSETDELEIADPYYGDADKFSQIFVLIEKAVEKVLRKISKEFTEM